MQIIMVAGGTLSVGPGARLLLSPAQASDRGAYLEGKKPIGDDGMVVASARVLQQFKAGEVLGLDEVPKSMAHLVEDPGASPLAKAFGKALRAYNKQAEEAERLAARQRQAADQERKDAAAAKAEAEWRAEYDFDLNLQKQYSSADAYVAARRAGKLV